MDYAAYKNFLLERLTRNFDFLDVNLFSLFALDFYAKYSHSSEKFFFSKQVNLYRIENDTIIMMLEIKEPLHVNDINYYRDQLQQYMTTMLQVGPDHMASIVTLVLISAHEITPDVAAAIKKTKCHKDFMFTLRGWADLAFLVVDLNKDQLYYNAFGEKLAHIFDWNA